MAVWKRIAIAIGLISGVIMLAWGTAQVLAYHARASALEQWSRFEEPTIHVRYQEAARTDATAEHVQAAISRFGLSPADGTATPTTRFVGTVRRQLSEWLDSRFERNGPGGEAIPGVCATFLEDHQGDLEALVASLDDGFSSRGNTESSSQNVPNTSLTAHMHLSKILAAAAIAAADAGEHDNAWSYQRASWSVAQSLARRPDLLSKLFLIAILKNIAAVAREVDSPAPEWFAELDGIDLRRQVTESLYLEQLDRVSALDSMENTPREVSGEAILDEIWRAATAPYHRWRFYSAASTLAESALDALKSSPCAPVAPFGGDAPPPGSDDAPDVNSAYTRASIAELYLEEARILAHVRATRDANDGAWPRGVSNLKSGLCGGKWVYEGRVDGGMTLRYDGPVPDMSEHRGVRIPLEWEE